MGIEVGFSNGFCGWSRKNTENHSRSLNFNKLAGFMFPASYAHLGLKTILSPHPGPRNASQAVLDPAPAESKYRHNPYIPLQFRGK